MVQTADKAMDEQIKILDTIKTKATQAAADGQSLQSRQAIQNDITKLLEELDNIANTTSYNGLNLLSGSFTNKQFQIGAYSRETVNVTIGDTTSAKIGAVRSETSGTIQSAGTNATLTFTNADGSKTTIAATKVSNTAGTGLGALAEAINRVSDVTGVKASYKVVATASGGAVTAGQTGNMVINGITIGTLTGIKAGDENGALRNAINAATTQTGVVASIDEQGRLSLTSVDGRGIVATGMSGAANTGASITTFGRLTLTSLSARDIVVSGGSATLDTAINANAKTTTQNLRSVMGNWKTSEGNAIGAYANTAQSAAATAAGTYLGSGVTTRAGAMLVMDIAESAMKTLDRIRAGLGSTQNQLVSTINNISVTQVNVAAAESQIRDVDFAAESANFSKRNILAQS
ncbi:MAG TPA: flagellin hook IN motif-containing protein, partial [Campylobacterales bacterium]|nr:flagellin hook IN motif-containing protein [Campylobacterales bacterium]